MASLLAPLESALTSPLQLTCQLGRLPWLQSRRFNAAVDGREPFLYFVRGWPEMCTKQVNLTSMS